MAQVRALAGRPQAHLNNTRCLLTPTQSARAALAACLCTSAVQCAPLSQPWYWIALWHKRQSFKKSHLWERRPLFLLATDILFSLNHIRSDTEWGARVESLLAHNGQSQTMWILCHAHFKFFVCRRRWWNFHLIVKHILWVPPPRLSTAESKGWFALKLLTCIPFQDRLQLSAWCFFIRRPSGKWNNEGYCFCANWCSLLADWAQWCCWLLKLK